MDSDEYVRLEVADTDAGGEVVLIGYFRLEPHDEESCFRVVDDYLFRLSPHKVTYRSEELGILCSRYTLPLRRVGHVFRKGFLRCSLQLQSLVHAHRLEAEKLLKRLEASPAAMAAKARERAAQTDEDDVREGVKIEKTRGYWGQLASH